MISQFRNRQPEDLTRDLLEEALNSLPEKIKGQTTLMQLRGKVVRALVEAMMYEPATVAASGELLHSVTLPTVKGTQSPRPSTWRDNSICGTKLFSELLIPLGGKSNQPEAPAAVALKGTGETRQLAALLGPPKERIANCLLQKVGGFYCCSNRSLPEGTASSQSVKCCCWVQLQEIVRAMNGASNAFKSRGEPVNSCCSNPSFPEATESLQAVKCYCRVQWQAIALAMNAPSID
jgi:hypothetical protein